MHPHYTSPAPRCQIRRYVWPGWAHASGLPITHAANPGLRGASVERHVSRHGTAGVRTAGPSANDAGIPLHLGRDGGMDT
jgi:hypothetical protein